jgi:hypothetical protein
VPVPRCVSRHPEAQPCCALRVTFLAHRPEGAELVRPVILSPSIVLSPSFIVSPALSATVVVGRDRSLPVAARYYSVPVGVCRWLLLCIDRSVCFHRSFSVSPFGLSCLVPVVFCRSLSVATTFSATTGRFLPGQVAVSPVVVYRTGHSVGTRGRS